jgi:TRAP-type C4-dicarboxylate transport system substrate-binding protein
VRLLALLLLASTTYADGPTALRFATIAPDGTAWAREVKAFARDLETQTNGAVHARWYLGGIAGDELAVLERIRRGQLDGVAAAHGCDQLAPSLRVMHIVGLFRSHEEILFVLNKLQPLFEEEFRQHGFVDLGMSGGFGQTIFFSRQPARTLAELKRDTYWIWDLDAVERVQLGAIGIRLAPLSVEAAAKAYDEKRVDGFIAIPTAALAYQWSAQARYFTPLMGGFLPGCFTMSTAAFDALPIEQQQTLRHAAATLIARFEDVGRQQDQQLLSSLFQKQGLQRIDVSPQLAREFSAAALGARDKLDAKLVRPEVMQKVLVLLDEYRTAHH